LYRNNHCRTFLMKIKRQNCCEHTTHQNYLNQAGTIENMMQKRCVSCSDKVGLKT
jgi:hypothetical protein